MAHWETLDSGISNAVLSLTSKDNSGPVKGGNKTVRRETTDLVFRALRVDVKQQTNLKLTADFHLIIINISDIISAVILKNLPENLAVPQFQPFTHMSFSVSSTL